MSDPKGETPHPEHPQDGEFELEFVAEPEGAAPEAPHGEEHAAAEEPHPLDALNINASTDEFHFSGPVEELDFTEPADFTVPTEQAAEAEPVSDSMAEIPDAEHMGLEHLLGTEEAAPHEAAAGEEAAVPAEAAAVEVAAEAEGEEVPQAKPKRELPAWVHTLEWTTVAVLAVGAVIGLLVAAFFIDNADAVRRGSTPPSTLILNICCPLMLALIPYALWRSRGRWVKPAVTALYTVLLALGAAALIGGTWVAGMELANYKWQYSKARVTAGERQLQQDTTARPPAK